jgi:hypothetical protein
MGDTPHGVVWPPQYISFSFLFLDFFYLKKKNVMGAFWEKKGQSCRIAII